MPPLATVEGGSHRRLPWQAALCHSVATQQLLAAASPPSKLPPTTSTLACLPASTPLALPAGEQSRDFCVVLATNRPSDLDPAVIDRTDDAIEFGLPGNAER